MLIQKFRLLFYHEGPPPAIHLFSKTTRPIAHSKRIFLNICSVHLPYPFCLSSMSPALRHLLSPIASRGMDNICSCRKIFPCKNCSRSSPQSSMAPYRFSKLTSNSATGMMIQPKRLANRNFQIISIKSRACS